MDDSDTGVYIDPRVRRTRRALIDSAWLLIEKRGADVSLVDIAHEAGVSRQTIYFHYSDRYALLADAAIQRINEAMDAARNGPRTRQQETEALLTHLRTHDAFYGPMLTGPASGFHQHLMDYLAELQTDALHSAPPDVAVASDSVGDLGALARFLAGGTLSFIRHWLAQPREQAVDPQEATRQLRQIIRPFFGSPSALSHRRHRIDS